MNNYKAPLNDLNFNFQYMLDQTQWAQLPGDENGDLELYQSILQQAGRFASAVLAPINASADREGLTIHAGVVHTPSGFKSAYQQFIAAGWNNVTLDPEFGGQGLSYTLSTAVDEIMVAANKAFMMCPGLTIGAIEAIQHSASNALKQKYLPKLVSGEWSGTMNLTEPQAGSDVGALKTKAIEQADGHYRIHGQKIFISFGEHDLTQNIIHLVLARCTDSPEGVRGISLFLVPKYLLNDDGTLGPQNDLRCVSIEHKLGIHASPTCVMAYGDHEGAVGYLVGEKNKGLAAMFIMINRSRLAVGVEGVAVSERAYQAALNYAQQRIQGTDPDTGQALAIIEHADVRRMLMIMKSQVEAMRALSLFIAQAHDLSLGHQVPEQRQYYQGLVDLLTPVFKAWATETSLKTTMMAIQVHGGLGYVEETGVAQYLRDAIISVIYEGTTSIQSADLLGRKLIKDRGKNLNTLLQLMKQSLSQLQSQAELSDIADEFAFALALLEQQSQFIMQKYQQSAHAALSVSVPYLMLLGLICGAWQHAKAATHVIRLLATEPDDADFLNSKLESARFYHRVVLSEIRGLAHSISHTGQLVTDFDTAYFQD